MSTLELKKKLTDARTEFKLESGDDNLTITGYQTSPLRTFLFYFLSIITLGIFRLIAHWSVHFYINFRATRCTFDVADLVTVVDDHMAIQVRRMITMRSTKNSPVSLPDGHGGLKEVPHIRFFTFRKLKYFWLDREERFVTCADLEAGATMSSFRRNAKNGLSTSEVGQRMLTFGLNEIEVKLKPILVLLFREAISPFYIFQVFSVTVWFTDQYIYYACVIILMSVLSITTDIYQTRKQERKLRSMVHSVDDVSVLRNGGVEERIRSDQLVPGDVLLIPQDGFTLQCDAVLLNGTVIVNESMLTGESVPVTKVAIPEVEVGEEMDERFDIMVHAKHVLFCGTQVLQTRYYSGRHVKSTPTPSFPPPICSGSVQPSM